MNKILNLIPVLQGILMVSLLMLITRCSSPSAEKDEGGGGGKMLPRVLIITSGISDEQPQLAQGIVAAIQSFNKRGVTVRLEPRDILYDYTRLEDYSIIILSTFPGYHDADRKYSLSYMSDEELINLEKFVRLGGVLIAGDNTGRNYPDGTDRITLYEHLTPDNWELSKCYGASMAERNVVGYGLFDEDKGAVRWDFSAGQMNAFTQDLWVLVPDYTTSPGREVLASMAKGRETIPAILKNRYEGGMAYFLASSGFLQPINEGGYWSLDQIDRFYGYVLDTYNQDNRITSRLNPWPGGADYAFSISLNAEGSKDEFERVFRQIKGEGTEPTVFVNGLLDQETRDYLSKQGYPLASSGFSFINYNELSYPVTVEDILRNENTWNTSFTGFRFPFTQPGFYGMIALEEHGYKYESSIGANNMDFIQGAVVPYNLVISRDGYYRGTNLLEIAPTYHDDYYFLGLIDRDPSPDSISLSENVQVYSEYLADYWNYAVKPYNGLMVFLGHPRFVGYNDVTMTALAGLIGEVKKEDTWLATLDQVAQFRSGLEAMQFYSDPVLNGFNIRIIAPEGIRLNDVCLKVSGTVRSASAHQGEVKVTDTGSGSNLVFDAFNGQSITVKVD